MYQSFTAVLFRMRIRIRTFQKNGKRRTKKVVGGTKAALRVLFFLFFEVIGSSSVREVLLVQFPVTLKLLIARKPDGGGEGT